MGMNAIRDFVEMYVNLQFIDEGYKMKRLNNSTYVESYVWIGFLNVGGY